MVLGFRFTARKTGSPGDAQCYQMTGYAHLIVGHACTMRISKFMCHVLKIVREFLLVFVTHMFNVTIFCDVRQHCASLKLAIFDFLIFSSLFLVFCHQNCIIPTTMAANH
jgi:hypothetical protein